MKLNRAKTKLFPLNKTILFLPKIVNQQCTIVHFFLQFLNLQKLRQSLCLLWLLHPSKFQEFFHLPKSRLNLIYSNKKDVTRTKLTYILKELTTIVILLFIINHVGCFAKFNFN